MKGYTVITSDDRRAGHVVDVVGDNLIVEHGVLFKRRRPLPRAFAHADDLEQVIRTSISSRILENAPDADDTSAVAQHYGLEEPEPRR